MTHTIASAPATHPAPLVRPGKWNLDLTDLDIDLTDDDLEGDLNFGRD